MPHLGICLRFTLQISFILSGWILHTGEERSKGSSGVPFLQFESSKHEKGWVVSGGGILFSISLNIQLEKILGKNSDWPRLVSVAFSGPIRNLFPEERRDVC